WIVQLQCRKYGTRSLPPLAGPRHAKVKNAPEATNDSTEVVDQAPVHPSEQRAGESRPLAQRIANISETALHDFIDIMVFLTLGACLAGATKVWGPSHDEIQPLASGDPALTTPGMLGMAIAMCLGSAAAAVAAASLTTLH